MGKKVSRVRYRLQPENVQSMPFEEIKMILRGADDLIMQGGRNLLAKLLKGSKDKKVMEYDLNENPVYGSLKHLKTEEIMAKIDWLITHGYLRIEYDYRLPLLVYAPKGWEIEKDTYSDELLKGFDKMLDEKTNSFNMSYLKDRARDMIFLLLDKVADTGNAKYIPLLEAWKKIDYKKVQKRINKVIEKIKGND